MSVEGYYVCGFCNYKTKDSKEFDDHEKGKEHMSHFTHLYCEYCDIQFWSSYKYYEHTDTSKHKKSANIIIRCDMCDYSTSDKQLMEQHNATQKHSDKVNGVEKPVYQCIECNYVTKFKSQYDQHTSTQKHLKNTNKVEQKLFECIKCNIRFRFKSKFDEHNLSKKHKKNNEEGGEENVNYNCVVCDYKGNSKQLMEQHNSTQKHINAVNRVKPPEYECITCNFKSRFKSKLQEHVETKRHKDKISLKTNKNNNYETSSQDSKMSSEVLVYSETKETQKIQDTGKFRLNTKDQFYTNKDVAKSCIEKIIEILPFTEKYLWLEPSAGNGAFLHNLPTNFEKLGLDLDPNSHDIKEQDYLKWEEPKDKDIIVFGNPPFGKQSSLAKLFIKKSCKFANIIAFILPKSFTKPSMFNTFDFKFHLLYSTELGKDSFIINGCKYDVPCVFQIWQKKDEYRIAIEKIISKGFRYVKPSEKYDIAFKRVGGLAGKCYKNNGISFNIQSHYFIVLDEDYRRHIDRIIEEVNNHIFPSNTTGPRSLSKSEANIVINNILYSINY